jgi:hypothetical protein
MAGLMNFSPLSRQNLEKFSLRGNSSFGQNLVFTSDSAIDDGHSLNGERYWHENCINTDGFSRAHRPFKKKIGAGQREAKEKKEDKMIWTEGNQP